MHLTDPKIKTEENPGSVMQMQVFASRRNRIVNKSQFVIITKELRQTNPLLPLEKVVII